MTENLKTSRKKPFYKVSQGLRKYLRHYGREVAVPVSYNDLLHFAGSIPLYDNSGNDLLWETVYYDPSDMRELYPALARSEERRVGKECVRPCRSGWEPGH